MEKAELIAKCIAGDATSWDSFVRRYSCIVLRGIRYKLRRMGVKLPDADQRDMVQEIFLSVWENGKLPMLRDADCLEAWLTMLAINYVSNYCRRRSFKDSRNVISLGDKCDFDEEMRVGDMIPSLVPDAFAEMKRGELRDRIESELSTLSPRNQLALKFSLYDGSTHRTIARIMNMPINAVSTIIRRGRRDLSEKISQYLNETG